VPRRHGGGKEAKPPVEHVLLRRDDTEDRVGAGEEGVGQQLKYEAEPCPFLGDHTHEAERRRGGGWNRGGKKRIMDHPLELGVFGWRPILLYITQIEQWVTSSVGASLRNKKLSNA
jgi:hypothetical protein